MPLTALTPSALIHNKAQNVTVGGTTADTANFNSAPNIGTTIVIIQTGATAGTVAVSFARGIDGVTPSDVNILDQGGSALANNSNYVLALGNIVDYGNPVTIKATQATTKFTVMNVGVA
jgi:hypothetical protein